MIVAAILGKGVCDSLNYEAVLMCLYPMALLARVRFRANPNPSSRNLRKLLEKQGQVRFWWTVVFAKKGPVPVFPAIFPEFIIGLGLDDIPVPLPSPLPDFYLVVTGKGNL